MDEFEAFGIRLHRTRERIYGESGDQCRHAHVGAGIMAMMRAYAASKPPVSDWRSDVTAALDRLMGIDIIANPMLGMREWQLRDLHNTVRAYGTVDDPTEDPP